MAELGFGARFPNYVLSPLGGFTELLLQLLQFGEAGKPRTIFLDSLAARVLDADSSLPTGRTDVSFGKLI